MTPPQPVANLRVQKVAENYLELTWDLPTRSDSTLTYHITCHPCENDKVSFHPSNLVSSNRVRVEGLQPASEYKFTVYAQNAVSNKAGVSWTRNTDLIASTSEVMVMTIKDIESRWINKETLKLVWDFQVSGDNHEALEPVGYQVCLMSGHGASRADKGLVAPLLSLDFSKVASFTLTRLDSERQYLVQVRAAISGYKYTASGVMQDFTGRGSKQLFSGPGGFALSATINVAVAIVFSLLIMSLLLALIVICSKKFGSSCREKHARKRTIPQGTYDLPRLLTEPQLTCELEPFLSSDIGLFIPTFGPQFEKRNPALFTNLSSP
ncbi:hypothetical protein Ciccas_001657 [Cichlidogyrus casuarinus]|uniref:Fibronectin type-III domain-containing protein n=1 Tax=Cichlidogyrus casuarinus TaxID=1844966 RepID=A0ABD2QJH9_9PLAT